MSHVRLVINGQNLEVPVGTTILEAARQADIYIPALCSHPDLPPAEGIGAAKAVYQGNKRIENALPGKTAMGCGLCVVEVKGEAELARACSTEIRDGMVVTTDSDRIREARKEYLVPILSRHRHACLTCAQQEGCSRSQCSTNVPENERCCSLFGHCELQRVVNYIGISPATPRWLPTNLPILKEDPLFERDYNLCIGCTRCVRACRELRGIEAIGFVFDENGLVQIGTLAPTLLESGCKFCTACVEVCPTGALMDKFVRAGKKEEDLVPCKEACPVHMDIPGYLRLLSKGKRDEAHALIREKVPFPGALGRICIHPCEEVCRRAKINDPISICALKRYAADGDPGLWKKRGKTTEKSGKKVAVVGAGPAGLTAAFYLRKKGHDVTVFEARSRAGGMMRYGIPSYRLPRDIVDKEIRDIFDLGIHFQFNHALGKDFTLDDLKVDGFAAVFLGVGAQLSRRISMEGSDHPDVLWGVDFLGQIAGGEKLPLKDRVIVVGGGNVAVDAALSAKRCGAKEVSMVCLESRGEMPAHEWEVEGILAEGIRLMPCWGVHRILHDGERIEGMELVRCTSVFDERGNFSPAFDDKKASIEGEQVIVAVGQTPDLSFLAEDGPILVDKGLIVVNEETLETGLEGVYAGGDVTSIPGAVIHAIAAGRKASSSIDRALGGDGDIEEALFERKAPRQFLGRDEGFALWSREKIPELELETRHQCFSEISLGYGDEQAMKEASRCLQCDLRLYLARNPLPPDRIMAFSKENINGVPEAEGVYRLYDEERHVLAIKGSTNLREDLIEQLEAHENAAWFDYEEDKMYSKREGELLQAYLKEHGKMPGSGDLDLDDLF